MLCSSAPSGGCSAHAAWADVMALFVVAALLSLALAAIDAAGAAPAAEVTFQFKAVV